MINKIFAYGDSFVIGTGVNPTASWISLLGKRLNLDVINRGVSGGSNKLSINILFADLKDIVDTPNHLVIFSWTSMLRSTFYYNDQWQNIQLGHHYEDAEIRNRVDTYYKRLYNDYEGYTEFYQQQIMLSGLLDSKKINYVFVNSFSDSPFDTNCFKEEKDYFEQFIDRNKYVLGKDSIFNVVCNQQKMVCADGFHPSESGHIWMADKMISHLEQTKL
jgi:hypothetical protein